MGKLFDFSFTCLFAFAMAFLWSKGHESFVIGALAFMLGVISDRLPRPI